MTETEWHTFLSDYSDELLHSGDLLSYANVSNHARHSRWLGFPPATASEINAAEDRLKQNLPPSLRNFYLVTNGWMLCGYSIYDIQPVNEVNWLAVSQRQLFDLLFEHRETMDVFEGLHDQLAALQAMQPSNLRNAAPEMDAYWYEQSIRPCRSLVLNKRGDAAFWMLDPGQRDAKNEWSAGFWASWEPGARWGLNSFADLLKAERDSFRETIRKLRTG